MLRELGWADNSQVTQWYKTKPFLWANQKIFKCDKGKKFEHMTADVNATSGPNPFKEGGFVVGGHAFFMLTRMRLKKDHKIKKTSEMRLKGLL